MAKTRKTKSKTSLRNWNEFNTFTKLIYPYLQNDLGYPERSSQLFDEQTWVRKRGEKKGPYDGAFKDERGILVLIEAKKESKNLDKDDFEQAFDYCLGETFPLPPPYVLVSNGHKHFWFRRIHVGENDFKYSPCDNITWSKALEQSGSGELIEQLNLSKFTRLLSKVRNEVFSDLTIKYFPRDYKLSSSNLGNRRLGFERILNTRKSFVDASLGKMEEAVAIRNILSSISLSITLKMLFLKILYDKNSEPLPVDLKRQINLRANNYPGILIAEPYDALEISDDCEEIIHALLAPVGVMQALLFEAADNPIGDIWDGLVESEMLDLQVKSLGNVYTPNEIVKSMVDSVEYSIDTWLDTNVLEPACGSGHFVREVYKRIRDSYLNSRQGVKPDPIAAHKEALKNIRALDIDPFAVQTTQLGMFLELYRSADVWHSVAHKDQFDFSKVVDQGDFLDDGLEGKFTDFEAKVIIGNPPYGVKITKTVANRFDLSSNDSYGAFISRSLDILDDNGYLVFVVSNTFMTTKSHQKLREQIFEKSKIESILQLHRSAFPGRDVFCCLFKAEKKQNHDTNYFYRFCDAWAIKPKTTNYLKSLENWSINKQNSIEPECYFEYDTNADLARSRRVAPHAIEVEPFLDSTELIGQRALVNQQALPLPIFGGRSSLFLICADEPYQNIVTNAEFNFPCVGAVEGRKVQINNFEVKQIKLWQIARVFQGLCTSDDEHFLRKSPGVNPNARRKYIKDVDLKLTIKGDALKRLTEDEVLNGIQVLDKARTPHFVPFDKGGEQDTEGGQLRAYWSDEDYWIDWSRQAVSLLKERNSWPQGTSRKPRLQNTRFYFTQGIRFAPAGLYAPTFELSFGGVPGHKGSIILPINEDLSFYLLPILCSSAVRYITKNFLQHTVMTEIDIIKQIPIPVPTEEQYQILRDAGLHIVELKKQGMKGDSLIDDVDKFVYDMYGFSPNDQVEYSIWFKRRYPNFGRGVDLMD